jgi:hypothetical protein
MTVTILFFKSTGLSWPVGLLIRLFTRRPGQRLADTPSHVAIEVSPGPLSQGLVYQMVCSGICRDEAESIEHSPGLLQRVEALVTHPEAVLAFCEWAYERRAAYDWVAIFCDILGFFLPATVRFEDHNRRKYDCSRFVAAALAAGGHAIREPRDPISPNDLYNTLTKNTRKGKGELSHGKL